MKNDLGRNIGSAFGEALNKLSRIHNYRSRQCDTILDAYIRSGITGRSYQEERDELLRKRGLGTIDD